MGRIVNFMYGVLTAASSLIISRVLSRCKAAEASSHSPPSCAEFNNGCSSTSALPYDFTTCTVTKWSCSLPYEIRNAHKILRDHWTMLQDTVQCYEPQLHGPAIVNCYRGPPQQDQSLPFQPADENVWVWCFEEDGESKTLFRPSASCSSFSYVNVATYQLHMSEHAKGTSHSFM
jgi:hypothetical protein